MTTVGIVHAILGCGRVAINHVDAISRVPGGRVEWACDIDGDVMARFAERHGIPRRTRDFRDVLADPAVTSVSVTTGHAQHAPLTEAALLAGKHVLVEKPMALSLDDARRLRDLANERGLQLGVVAQHRFDPLVVQVRRWMDGSLGRVLMINATLQCARRADYYENTWRGRWDTEGGSALINQGYHYIDLLVHLGGGITDAIAVMDTLTLGEHIETDDTFCAALRFANGALGTLAITVSSSVAWRSRIDVIGSSGSIAFDLDHPDTLHSAEGSEAFRAEADAFVRNREREDPPAGLSYYGISHRRQVAEFCAAIESGAPLSAGANEGISTLEAIARLYAAASEKSVSAVPTPTRWWNRQSSA